MAVSQDRIRAALEAPNPAVLRLAKAFAADDHAWSPDLDTSRKVDAFNAVFRYVASLSRGSVTEIANDAARLWDRIDAGIRRQLAVAPLSADGLIASVATTDVNVSARLTRPPHHSAAVLPDADPAGAGIDAMGRDRWARMIGAAEIGACVGSSAYGALTTSYDASKGVSGLTAQNFAQSPFAAVGLDLQTTLRLGAMGFSAQNILAGAGNALHFGFGVRDEQAVRDFATIDRYDPRAREFVARLEDYQRRLRTDEDLRKLEDERRQTQDRERQRELDREIKQRRKVLARETGVDEHIRRTEHDGARGAQQNRKEGVEKQQDVNKALNAQHGIEAGRTKDERAAPLPKPSEAGVVQRQHTLFVKGEASSKDALAAKF